MPLRLVVGQRTLNPLGEVRILEGQPEPRAIREPGDVVKWFNTEVCKTSIHRFESGRRLHRPSDDPLGDQRVFVWVAVPVSSDR